MGEAQNLSEADIITYSIIIVALVLGAGLMSGLTLGLLSLDVLNLEVLRVSGSRKARNAAGRLIPLVSKPHWLLCTLLLCNSAFMETLPIFLDKLVDPISAIVLSVTAILMFGEIIPQAVCSRYGVTIGAALAPLVRALMWLCAPITWPLGKILDFVLGHGDVLMKRREIKAIVTLHGEGAGLGGNLSAQEVKVIEGALELRTKTAAGAMTPIAKVFMLSDSALLDQDLVAEVLQRGHSRVPVYRGNDRNEVIGLILVKEMLKFWRSAEVPRVGDLQLRPLPSIPCTTPMADVLAIFQTGRAHMALLMAPDGCDIEMMKQNSLVVEEDELSCSSSSSSSSNASQDGEGKRRVRFGGLELKKSVPGSSRANSGDHEGDGEHQKGFMEGIKHFLHIDSGRARSHSLGSHDSGHSLNGALSGCVAVGLGGNGGAAAAAADDGTAGGVGREHVVLQMGPSGSKHAAEAAAAGGAAGSEAGQHGMSLIGAPAEGEGAAGVASAADEMAARGEERKPAGSMKEGSGRSRDRRRGKAREGTSSPSTTEQQGHEHHRHHPGHHHRHCHKATAADGASEGGEGSVQGSAVSMEAGSSTSIPGMTACSANSNLRSAPVSASSHQSFQQQAEAAKPSHSTDLHKKPSVKESAASRMLSVALRTASAAARVFGGGELARNRSDGDTIVQVVPVGIITLEDIIEELMQTEIVDETDTFMDNDQTEKVDLQEMLETLPPHLRVLLQAEVRQVANRLLARTGSGSRTFGGLRTTGAPVVPSLSALGRVPGPQNPNSLGVILDTEGRRAGKVGGGSVSTGDEQAAAAAAEAEAEAPAGARVGSTGREL